MQDPQETVPGSGRFLWRRKWQLTPGFLPGESHGQNSLVYYVHTLLPGRQRVWYNWATKHARESMYFRERRDGGDFWKLTSRPSCPTHPSLHPKKKKRKDQILSAKWKGLWISHGVPRKRRCQHPGLSSDPGDGTSRRGLTGHQQSTSASPATPMTVSLTRSR